MRLIATSLLLLALPSAAQAIHEQPGPEFRRMPGIVERNPGTTRLPGAIEIRTIPGDPFVAHDLRETRETIDRRYENGELTRREARRLRREVRLVDRLQYRYGYDGLRADERAELAMRAQELRSRAAAPVVRRP
jgi:hypothetical protein